GDAVAAIAGIADRTHQGEALVQRRGRLHLVALRVGDADAVAGLGRRDVAAGGKRQRQKCDGNERLHLLSPSPLASHAARPIAFCRRLCTDEPSPIASRYLATVRRAMSKPSPLSMSTSWSSDKIFIGSSAPISALIRLFTASDEAASPPSLLWMPLVK